MVGASRSFFVFDLSEVTTSSQIVSASLELEVGNVTQGIFGGISYTLYGVETPIASLVAGGSGLIKVYDDLGAGAPYSAVSLIFPKYQGTVRSIPLLPQGVKAVEAAKGSQIAIGGSPSQFAGNFAFGGTDETGVRLAIEFGWSPAFITDSSLVGTKFTLRFTGEPGVTDWQVMGTQDLRDFMENRTADSTISETSPGFYEAVVELGLLTNRYFIRIAR